jgi:hypothetical protein
MGLIVFNPKMKYLTPEQVYKQFGDHPKTTAEWAVNGSIIIKDVVSLFLNYGKHYSLNTYERK